MVSFIAVKWLLRYVQSHTFIGFGVSDRLWTSAALASPAWIVNLIAPDLQAAVFCEDVRAEISGQQTLVGVFGVIPAHALPIDFFKLCLWTRWCGGAGQFVEKSLILACDDEHPITQSELRFSLPDLDLRNECSCSRRGCSFSATASTIEIRLDGELRLRFPLPVVRVQPAQPAS